MEALITGGAECAPDGGRNHLSQLVKHLEGGPSDGSFQDQFLRQGGMPGPESLMQHAGPSSFVEEFQAFNVGPAGPMHEAFRAHEMKSDLERMLERQAPPMAMGAVGGWANEFEQFQAQPHFLKGASDEEFEAAFRAAAGPYAKGWSAISLFYPYLYELKLTRFWLDWGAEFAVQEGLHAGLDQEFERMEQAFSSVRVKDDALEAAWTEQFSRVTDSLDVKGKGKAEDAELDATMSKYEEEFNRIKDKLDAEGELTPEMMDKFNDLWKSLADKAGEESGGASDKLFSSSDDWAYEFNEGDNSVLDPDPVTAPLAPYHFEENNPYLADPDPLARGLEMMKDGANLSAAALAFEAAVQRDPNNSDAWMYLGRVQAENEKEMPAIAALQRSGTRKMLSGFFIFNAKGEVLISRLYRPDIKRSVADVFRIQVISSTDVRSPITTVASTAFFHIKHENLYLVAVTKQNANGALIFEFLYKAVDLGRSYFGKFDEDAVKNNFTLIYELMDEICDFGYPQNTEAETLKLFITTEGVKSERAVMEGGQKIAIQATGAVAWRRPDIKYRKNEAFVDVIESVNLLMSTKGTVLRSDVSGQVMMRAYLSGMPECKFGLNDRVVLDNEARGSNRPGKADSIVELDDAQFHQCVKLGNFEQNRTINFIPPDGEFELM
ncbi:hypothetical protein HDU96_002378, partial [Phlyctochytrium bullatum]